MAPSSEERTGSPRRRVGAGIRLCSPHNSTSARGGERSDSTRLALLRGGEVRRRRARGRECRPQRAPDKRLAGFRSHGQSRHRRSSFPRALEGGCRHRACAGSGVNVSGDRRRRLREPPRRPTNPIVHAGLGRSRDDRDPSEVCCRARERDKRGSWTLRSLLRGRAKHLDWLMPSILGVQHEGDSVRRRDVLILGYRRGGVG